MSWRRLLVAGLFVATAVGRRGGLLEWWWFGLSAAASGDRAERYVQRRFDGMVASLETVSLRIAAILRQQPRWLRLAPTARVPSSISPTAARALGASPDDIAVTVYDQNARRQGVGRTSF